MFGHVCAHVQVWVFRYAQYVWIYYLAKSRLCLAALGYAGYAWLYFAIFGFLQAYGWEDAVQSRLAALRASEARSILTSHTMRAINQGRVIDTEWRVVVDVVHRRWECIGDGSA